MKVLKNIFREVRYPTRRFPDLESEIPEGEYYVILDMDNNMYFVEFDITKSTQLFWR